ncbi:cupredoxin domain-containing protein [Sphingomonas baiyangensis]|uniref:Methylamine utilization protein n=1 Tax=Sphingomonas baiyangensis TaxID=2572576 RepID=A0A4U1L9Z3_9SPHN|nr:methylamine utilization protein [Sphingomonas baiyangensis]TKD53285.1 methylamine utilization protein [Sphingomonas baiyangensis]
MTRFALALPALLATLPVAHAGTLDLRLVDAAGRPVPDAVVTIRPDAGVPRGPIRFPWGTTMTQQDIAFNPRVLIVPVGATVAFPNRDKVRHHVYSFSKPARFEIKLYGRDETRSYTFKTPGAVAIGCNIHDAMNGYIKVVDTPFAAKSDAQGLARIAGASGAATVTIWHPRMKAKDNQVTMRVPLDATGTVSRRVALALR